MSNFGSWIIITISTINLKHIYLLSVSHSDTPQLQLHYHRLHHHHLFHHFQQSLYTSTAHKWIAWFQAVQVWRVCGGCIRCGGCYRVYNVEAAIGYTNQKPSLDLAQFNQWDCSKCVRDNMSQNFTSFEPFFTRTFFLDPIHLPIRGFSTGLVAAWPGSNLQ